MAEQRYRDKKDKKFGGGGEPLKVAEDVKKVKSSGGGRGGSGLFSVDYFKTLPYNWNTKRPDDFSLGGWDVLGGVILAGIASHGGETIDALRADSIELNWRIMMQPIFHSARARSIAKRIVDLCGGSAVRRVHLHRPICGGDGWGGLDTKENVETLDFGRDTNRLDYFRVTPFDVHAGNDLRGIADYGGGFRTREVSVGNSSYNGRGGGGSGSGRNGCGEMVGPRLHQERGSTGAGGGDRTRQVAVEIFANNDGGGGGGEVVVERLEKERGGAGNVDGSERWIDGEEGGRLVVAGWWNNWWLLLALWK